MLSLFCWIWLYLDPPDASFVYQEVDTVAVAHVRDGAELVFFFDYVQGEWGLLDHRWLIDSMGVGFYESRWLLFWYDDGDRRWRLVSTKRWVETWEQESPLAANQNRPWFRRALVPGLKQ